MQLLYTNSFEYQYPQDDATKSLGPYPSDTAIPADLLHSLFGEITSGQSSEVRAIVLKNTSGADVTSDISLYWNNNSADKSCKYSMGIEALTQPDASKLCQILSSVNSINAIPSNVTFYYNEGTDNALTIPASVGTPFAQGEYYAIWIRREVNSNFIERSKTCDELYTEFSTAEVSQVTSVTMPINTAGAVNGQYWNLDTLQGKYYVWYSSSAAGSNPLQPNKMGIKVDVLDDDSAVEVATKTQAKLSSYFSTEEVSFVLNSNEVIITLASTGTAVIDNGTMSGASVSNGTEGTSYSVESIEDIDIIISY